MGSVDSIETFGLVDGPGIRTVVFFSGCRLRCLFCHNPEMFQMQQKNMTVSELVHKIMRSKPYFKRNNGGVTFSGGEPLLQVDFLIEVCKKLKAENIHIALDTAGVGIGKYEEILALVDLVILDIKHTNPLDYEKMTGAKFRRIITFPTVAMPFWKHDQIFAVRMTDGMIFRHLLLPGAACDRDDLAASLLCLFGAIDRRRIDADVVEDNQQVARLEIIVTDDRRPEIHGPLQFQVVPLMFIGLAMTNSLFPALSHCWHTSIMLYHVSPPLYVPRTRCTCTWRST